MNKNKAQVLKMASWRQHIVAAGAVLAGLAFGTMAMAQDFTMHRGSAGRTGVPVIAPSTPSGTLPSVYNNLGRSFLRWWDPVRVLDNLLDNSTSKSSGAPAASWLKPTGSTLAANYYQLNLSLPAYEMARTVGAKDYTDPTAPVTGTAAVYSWTFDTLTAGQQYQVYVNLPIGPTSLGAGLIYPQRYYVYQITGIVGGPQTQIVDAIVNGGGYVQIGNGNVTADTAGTIVVKLYNTTPKRADGTYLDPIADPGNEVVYADAAKLVSMAGTTGSIVASPVVTELQAPPLGGGTEKYLRRVLSARNEASTIGAANATLNFGVMTSFTHDGTIVDTVHPNERRNMVWSWPVMRPIDYSAAEATRYALDKQSWAAGPNAENRRYSFIKTVDNLNGGVSFAGSFAPDTTIVKHIGPNYLAAPVVVGTANSSVTYAPNMPDGQYTIFVWIPDATEELAQGVTYTVYVNGVAARSEAIDQSAGGGWVVFPYTPKGGWNHSQSAPLSIRVWNSSALPSDAGRKVMADAVRFVKTADLSINSTPLQITTPIRNASGTLVTRDVAIVANENGRIYCIDAHGDATANAAPTIFWCYPSEVTPDPNAVTGEDGEDRIAEAPTGFNLSSALVAHVGSEDLLYIGTTNGKVYCLEMSGRGDGATRRRWTYPDDYNPSDPTKQMAASALGPIVGSVAYGTAGGSTPTIYVPTSQGRIIALDAAGDPATKTTTVRWQYPLATDTPLGPITMTPTVAFGKVYFGAPQAQGSSLGRLFALDEAAGTVTASLDTLPDATKMGAFGTSSGVAIPANYISGYPNTLYYVAPTPGGTKAAQLVSLSEALVANWAANNELNTDASGSLGVTYMSVYDNTGGIINDVPVVVCPTRDGMLTAFFATGSLNRLGGHRAWAYQLEGTPLIASPAIGGKATTETRSWMYIGDSAGYTYSFNHNPGLGEGEQAITPGEAPGGTQVIENDPNYDLLQGLVRLDRTKLISPEVFENLTKKMADGSLTYGDVTAAASSGVVTRTNFEYGEMLYLLAYDLPTGTGTLANYYVELQYGGVGSTGQRRQLKVQAIPSGAPPPATANIVLESVPIVPTGSQAQMPGANSLVLRAVAPNLAGARSADVTYSFRLAHPLGISLYDGSTTRSLGITTDAGNAQVASNGNSGSAEPYGAFGPSLTSLSGAVGHGTTGVSQMVLVDRSLSRLLYGPARGLQNVRIAPGDVAWVKAADATGGVYKAFDSTIYRNFEDYPLNVPNTSLDYPNVDRDRLSFTKSEFGSVANPLFSGVTLTPPVITDAAIATYRTTAGYNAQLARTLSNTVFEAGVDVPRFQPPSNQGYYSSSTAYVDPNQAVAANNSNRVYRTFGLGLTVPPDERLAVTTPTVDLGSLPSGGGFNGGPGGGPLAPWVGTSAFSPWNPGYVGGAAAMFQPFTVVNEGNVNLLNVRLAKQFDDPSGTGRVYRPVELYAPGQHELSWLDARYSLFSDLDPRFAATGLAGVDPSARAILQKARPGDPAPTKLSVNPMRRTNANLGVQASPLLNPSVYMPGDPKVGVAAPIGTPSGSYVRNLFAFEDIGNNQYADAPSLGQDEAYSEPPMTLKFNVRETRLTNTVTKKSAPLLEDLPASNFLWSNAQPTALRDGNGNVVMAWASNRLDSSNGPSWDPKNRTADDASLADSWRIYLSTLRLDAGSAVGENPIADLNGFVPAASNRWLSHAVTQPFPSTFTFTLQPGESLVPGSANFGSPSFPTNGAFNMLSAPANGGRAASSSIFMAYLGQATKRDGAGNQRALNQLMLTPFTIRADGTATPAATSFTMPYDPETRKSKPSLVQAGARATVFYTSYAGGLGQINWNTFTLIASSAGANFGPTAALDLGNAFESIGAPSATLRRYRNGAEGRIGISFTGKLRGRPQAEAFLAQLRADGTTGYPVAGNPMVSFGTRIDPLALDPASGSMWAPGIRWRMGAVDVDPNQAGRRIDILRFRNGSYQSVLDFASGSFDRNTGILSYNTTLGGKVYLNAQTGQVSFAGALIPRSLRLYLQYTPYVLRVSGGQSANYRSVGMAYDDRFIGVWYDGANSLRNLVGDLSYWGNSSGGAAQPADPIRWDRTVLTYTRTSGVGSEATRPYLRSLRFGVKLPTPVAVNNATGAVDVTVNGSSSPFYQVDPATGRVFFMAEAEDQTVTITYHAVDETGVDLGTINSGPLTVSLIDEMSEQTVPIEQVGNESGLTMALDPMNAPFNSQNVRRPGLIWMFWTSTRSGGPDVFFQTIAPRFSPKPLAP